MKYVKCAKCEINYVEKEGDICPLCTKDSSDSSVCMYCGGDTLGGADICEVCLESLSSTELDRLFF